MNIKLTPFSEICKIIGDGEELNLSRVCKNSGKWAMFVAIYRQRGLRWLDEYFKAAPYLKYEENRPILDNGFGYFLFDYEDDMHHAFDITIGDRGPTAWNDYEGPAKVYAVICGPDGKVIDENT